MAFWLLKSEPEVYSFQQLEKEGTTPWTGIRNHQAKLNLLAMRPGDLCLYYHSREGKEIVGTATVQTPPYPDPTAEAGSPWVCVDITAQGPLAQPVTLQQIKEDVVLQTMPLVRHTRLSVMPITAEQFNRVLQLGLARAI